MMKLKFYDGEARDPAADTAKIAIVDADSGNLFCVVHGPTLDVAQLRGRRLIDYMARTDVKRGAQAERHTIAQVRQTLKNAAEFLNDKPVRARMSDHIQRQIGDALAVMEKTWPFGQHGA